MTTAARAVVGTQYVRLGAVRRFRTARSPASNQHFIVGTAQGRYFLKVVARPDALYSGDGVGRLGVVARAVVELGAAELPVERIEPADDGRLVLGVRGAAYRLFRFIEGRPCDGGPQDLRRAAAALGVLHGDGRRALSPATRRQVAALLSPYPLSETRGDLDALQRYAEKKLKLQFGAILREAAAVAAGLKKSPAVLAHNDFHPGNVIFDSRAQPVIIDLDNLMFAPAHKCAAFAVLRFAVRRPADRTAPVLRRVARLWAEPYQRESGIALGPALYEWMVCLELEKILRIAARVRKTGRYAGFLRNIPLLHLPNLRFLMTDLI